MRIWPLWVLIAFAVGLTTDVRGADRCSAYVENSTPAGGDQAAVIPASLLEDSNTAILCLISLIKDLKSDVGPDGISKSASARLLSITAAFRTIIARADAADKIANATAETGAPKTTANIDAFSREFRKRDDIDTVAVLAYGTRSENSDIRLNSLIVLGDVIDNRTVCVLLAHLNDPSLLTHPNGANGRANLLGAVSVVAPWAYKENYENITRTVKAIDDSIPDKNDPSAKYTVAKIENIRARLASQKPNSNQRFPLPDRWREDCRTYVQTFVPKIIAMENVRYERPPN